MSEVEKMYHAWAGCKGGSEWQNMLAEVEEVIRTAKGKVRIEEGERKKRFGKTKHRISNV